MVQKDAKIVTWQLSYKGNGNMPFIDMPAFEDTCITSTLTFTAEQSNKCVLPAVVTFDQPLC
jgi:hypothetical protein